MILPLLSLQFLLVYFFGIQSLNMSCVLCHSVLREAGLPGSLGRLEVSMSLLRWLSIHKDTCFMLSGSSDSLNMMVSGREGAISLVL